MARKRSSRRRRSRSVAIIVEGRRIRAHKRKIRLRDGSVVTMLIREHVRTGKKRAHRLSSLPIFPAYQREMLERFRSQSAAATSDRPDEAYISPEEYAAQGYMEHQRRLRHLRQRR